MEELIGFVSETGFAILISIFLLVRMERKLEALTVCISDLAASINQINK